MAALVALPRQGGYPAAALVLKYPPALRPAKARLVEPPPGNPENSARISGASTLSISALGGKGDADPPMVRAGTPIAIEAVRNPPGASPSRPGLCPLAQEPER